MPSTTTTITLAARRLRDPANIAYPRAQLLRYLDHTQRVLNAYFKFAVTTVQPAQALLHTYSPLYVVTTITGDTPASIERVRFLGRTIDRIPDWRQLVQQDPNWLVTSGQRLHLWTTIGKDYLVLYPRLTTLPATGDVEIVYVPSRPSVPIDNGTQDLAISTDLLPVLQDFVETLGCMTGRRYAEASDPIARLELAFSQIETQQQTEVVEGMT
jgi:hypothetical protein